jgi:hypothetical protein
MGAMVDNHLVAGKKLLVALPNFFIRLGRA